MASNPTSVTEVQCDVHMGHGPCRDEVEAAQQSLAALDAAAAAQERRQQQIAQRQAERAQRKQDAAACARCECSLGAVGAAKGWEGTVWAVFACLQFRTDIISLQMLPYCMNVMQCVKPFLHEHLCVRCSTQCRWRSQRRAGSPAAIGRRGPGQHAGLRQRVG
jgi:hypothetical protein